MIISLLTDYGHEDDFVGVCHAVIASIAPEARVIDLTHGIPRGAVRRGALVLRNTLAYVPPGVQVAVVDPQVGTERRAIALRCHDGRLMVGPDNGLLSLAWQRAGGVELAVDVTRSPHRLEPVSATFHGRDIFAPVAAHLAAGAEPADAGEPVEPDELVRLELPEPAVDADGTVTAHALSFDRFGNVALDLGHDALAGTGLTLGREVEVTVHGQSRGATYAVTFADVGAGELIVYEDAYRTLAIAVNRGDARAELGIEPDDELCLRPA